MPSRKSAPYRIGVIGTINRDTIRRRDGSRVDSFGGILYNIKYLSSQEGPVVMPAVNIGADCHKKIISLIKGFSHVDLSLVRRVEAQNNHCFMHYSDQAHKCEFLAGGVLPLTFARVKPLLASDLILVNFITGNDIKLAALERLRREYRGYIYMDIHSLTLGRKKVRGGMHRFLRRPRHWKRYAACADILQVNRAEFEILSGLPVSLENVKGFLLRQLPSALCLIVTLGEEGTIVVTGRRKMMARLIPATTVRKVHDTTGCGDAFAAGFVVEFLRGGDPIDATRRGNELAASRCRLRGPVF